MTAASELRFPALEVRQRCRRLYQFAIDGKQLPEIATVSRVHRDEGGRIGGYQRPEALAHIRAIRTYIESDQALMPNALVIAFDGRVRFEPLGPDASSDVALGELVIPVDPALSDEYKAGWIVDGQQRAAAIRDAQVEGFAMPVVAFITNSVAEQRAQFILVNSTKPLPKGLIHELLPSTEVELPAALARKRYPAVLVEALNYSEDSPVRGLIRTPTTIDGVIKDNSMLKMLENSITDGALYRFRDPATGEGDTGKMLEVLFNFWAAAKEVFEIAWGQPPRRSRLMHGVGIMSLGFVMDTITDRRSFTGDVPSKETYAIDLKRLAPVCRWTEGYWEFGTRDRRRWNELQNTPRDIQLLSDFLLAEYWARTLEDDEPRHLRLVVGTRGRPR